jgi:hypothetical protein
LDDRDNGRKPLNRQLEELRAQKEGAERELAQLKAQLEARKRLICSALGLLTEDQARSWVERARSAGRADAAALLMALWREEHERGHKG